MMFESESQTTRSSGGVMKILLPVLAGAFLAAVLLFLGFFVMSTVVLDVWKPIPIGP